MPTLVEDIGAHFVSLASSNEILTNFGATQFVVNSNLFYIIEPASPNNCVTIVPYGGAPLDVEHRFAQYPSVQIRVRANGVARAYKTTQAIINHLHLANSQGNTLGSDIPMRCFAKQSAPLFLDFSEEDYPIFVANFDFMITKYTVD